MNNLKPQTSNTSPVFIVIEGNIGSGKTTLAKNLAVKMAAKPSLLLEKFENNPYLRKFYKDAKQYALPAELWFLINRYEQIKKFQIPNSGSRIIISDYHISKCLIFAEANLGREEFLIYKKYFQLVQQLLPRPDILICLMQDIPQLKKNICTRGREYEKNISYEYLNKIQKGYEKYSRTYSFRKIIIDCKKINWMTERGIDIISDKIGLTSPC